jgi:hypothetical protein
MATTPESAAATDPAPAGMFDRDLDPSPALAQSQRSRRRQRREPPIQRYQRLLANPFLAAAGLVGWIALVRLALRSERIDYIGASIVLLVPLGSLLQFHCLDCGKTAGLWRWRSHCCEAVQMRRATGRGRWFRGPAPPAQTFLWLLVFGGAVVTLLRVLTSP